MKVFAASVRAIVADVDGNVIVVASVPASVRLLLTVAVLPSAMVSVEPVTGAVIDTLLTVVALSTPRLGVVSDGEVASTADPEPVTAVIAVPLILKLLPVPAVSKVLLVSVSVVARPTRVSVAAGSVRVPEAATLGCTTVVPLVEPDSVRVPSVEPATPRVGVAVKAGPAPASTWPAAPVIEIAPAPLTAPGAVPLMAPPEVVTHVAHVRLPVAALSASGAEAPTAKVPVVLGSVRVAVPAALWGVTVTVPEVAPEKASVPVLAPATPKDGVLVKAGPEPPSTWPAAPVIETLPVVLLRASGAETVSASVPVEVGSVIVGVPAAACGVIVAVPLEEPRSLSVEAVAPHRCPEVSMVPTETQLVPS